MYPKVKKNNTGVILQLKYDMTDIEIGVKSISFLFQCMEKNAFEQQNPLEKFYIILIFKIFANIQLLYII